MVSTQMGIVDFISVLTQKPQCGTLSHRLLPPLPSSSPRLTPQIASGNPESSQSIIQSPAIPQQNLSLQIHEGAQHAFWEDKKNVSLVLKMANTY